MIQKQFSVDNVEGYISSTFLTSPESAIDDISCIWLLKAQQGQVINITLIDFNPSDKQQSCHALGYVKDLLSGREIIICQTLRRENHVWTSSGSELEIQIGTVDTLNDKDSFILHYKGT